MSARAAEVIVVGAGAAGLSAAWRLHGRGVDVMVLEARPRAGGPVSTVAPAPGWRFERGPNSLRAGATHVGTLIRDLDLDAERIAARAAAKTRYIWRHGALHPVPASPRALWRSELLGLGAKARLLAEPLVPPRRVGDPGDETIAALCRRRLGAGAVEGMVDPVITGIFAGDPERLGADALPALRDAERLNGGFLRAMLRRARAARGDGSGIFSLRGGLGRITEALTARLGDRVRLEMPAARVEPTADGVVVHTRGGRALRARAVVVATPAHRVNTLLGPAPERDFLDAIPAPFVATVGLGYPRSNVAHDLRGFGVLAASDSPVLDGDRRVMGVVFGSSVFEGRAPEGFHALTVLIGGMHDPAAAECSDDALRTRAEAACAAMFGVRGAPIHAVLTRWSRAIPQLQPGHARAVARLEAGLPGRVQVAGSWVRGVSLDDAVASGFRAADRATAYMLASGNGQSGRAK